MEIQNLLVEFGLKEKESAVYLAALELGLAGVNMIAKKTKIKRTTVYDLLEGLSHKGLIKDTFKNKKRLIYAAEPETLKKILAGKQEKLNDLLPVLKSLYNIGGEKPKIRYYEGKEGLKEVYQDTLNYQGELLAFVSENILKYLGAKFAAVYKEKRARAKIFARVIGPNTEELLAYKESDQSSYKKTLLVPKDKYPFSIEMNIYGNKLAYMSFKEQMGVIIESNDIADNMRLLFNLAWQGAGGN